MRFIASGFTQTLLSVRTVTAVVIVGAFGLFYLSQAAGHPGLNAWDTLIPTLTDTSVVSVIGLIWWSLWLLPAMSMISREQTLTRYGSRARAVRANLAALLGSLCAWAFLLAVVCGALAMPLGFSSTWSAMARAVNGSQPSVFSSAAAAQMFASPWLALGASAVFTAVGYLAVASVALALSARGHQRAAVVGLVCFVLWAFVCSFSPTPIPSFMDASVPLSLAWALSVPGGVWLALLWLAIGFAGAAVAARIPDVRSIIRGLFTSRIAALLVLLCVAILASVNAALNVSEGVSPIRQFFAGAYGDIVGYVLVAAIPLGFASSYVARLSAAAEGPLLYEALRRGSYRRWLGSMLLREVWPAVVLCLLTGAALIITLVVTGHPTATLGRDGAGLTAGLTGLLAAIALLIAIASTIVWIGASSAVAWPIVVGTALVLGYSVPAGWGLANVVAPYGLPTDSATVTTPLIATTVTGVLAAVLITTAVRLATPARADLVA